MIESKSLKLYLFSFRNHGSFHEEVTNRIFNDLWIILQPYYLRVFGDFTVRGGIAIKPLVERCASCSSLNQQRIRSLIDAWDRMKHQCREI
jgi:NADPH-dependent 7-cyano-7-deazaguanine reductase QueF